MTFYIQKYVQYPLLSNEQITATPPHIIKHIRNVSPWLRYTYSIFFFETSLSNKLHTMVFRLESSTKLMFFFCCCRTVNGEQQFRNEWEKRELCVSGSVYLQHSWTRVGSQNTHITQECCHHTIDYILCGWFIFRVLTIYVRRQRRDTNLLTIQRRRYYAPV